MEKLYRGRAILYLDKVGQNMENFFHDREFLGRDKVGQTRSFLSRQSWPRHKVLSPTTKASADSLAQLVFWNQKNLYPRIPTAVANLLQYSGLGSN